MFSIFCALNLILTQQVYAESAKTPFVEDFETGSLGSFWQTNSTSGRIMVTSSYAPHAGSYHLIMDSRVAGPYLLNELVLTIDLAGKTGVKLSFYHKSFSDENHALPASFTGSKSGDGVSVSADGTTWYKVQGLTTYEGATRGWKKFEVNLDAALAAARINYTSTFKIKFQQYDNFPISSDGFAFDDIEVFESLIDNDHDGLPDDWELGFFGTIAEDPAGDYDADDLVNMDEYRAGTDPTDADTDCDRIPDGFEVEYDLDPLDPADADDDLDHDGISNLNEYLAGSDPSVPARSAASFPFSENFEDGSLRSFWKANSTGTGRVLVTSSSAPHGGSYHLTMDSSSSVYALNELVLNINLTGRTGVRLSFFQKSFRDESHLLPASFSGSRNGDGVSISADGTTWYKVQGLTTSEGAILNWKKFEVDLDAAIAAARINYTSTFKIKFQQYDNSPIPSDGFALDDIVLDVGQSGGDPGTPPPATSLSPTEQEVVRLVNVQRASNGLPPLQVVEALVVAAHRHSNDMAQHNFMSHTGSDGSTPWDRMRDAGYRLVYGGENVAAGYSAPASVINGWMNSSGHRANILSPNFCHVGAGYAYSSNSSYHHYWTLDFGCN